MIWPNSAWPETRSGRVTPDPVSLDAGPGLSEVDGGERGVVRTVGRIVDLGRNITVGLWSFHEFPQHVGSLCAKMLSAVNEMDHAR